MSDQCVRALLSMLAKLDFMPPARQPTETLELVMGMTRSVLRKMTVIIT